MNSEAVQVDTYCGLSRVGPNTIPRLLAFIWLVSANDATLEHTVLQCTCVDYRAINRTNLHQLHTISAQICEKTVKKSLVLVVLWMVGLSIGNHYYTHDHIRLLPFLYI